MSDNHLIKVAINGEEYTSSVEARMLLSDFIPISYTHLTLPTTPYV